MKKSGFTLEEHIYEEIKKAIFNRKIGPRTVLSEEQLAEAFNVSRTPVRHVLKRMHYENIVVIRPKKGVNIYEPSAEEMEEVFYVKMILEKEALKTTAEKITEEQLTKLEEMTYMEEQYYKDGKYYEGLMIANDFHNKLLEVCGNRRLLKYYKELTDLTNLYLAFYDHVAEYPPGPTEHRQIIQAIRSKSHVEIEKETVYHWTRVREHMIYHNEDKGELDLKTIFNPVKKEL